MNIKTGMAVGKSMMGVLAVPLASSMMSGADKLGDLAESGVLSMAKRIGVDGNGVKISTYWGAPADSAARAWLGKGPKWNGGNGMAGGDATLNRVGFAVAGLAAAAFIAAAIAADPRRSPQSDKEASVATCKNCQGRLTVVPVDSESAGSVAVCPHCGHGADPQK